jgi:transposase
MTKFNTETCTQIIKLLEQGNYRKTAAALAGVDESTFYKWIKRGEEAKSGKHFQFIQSVKRAEEKAKAYHLQQIRKASEKGSWQASAWYLERKHYKEWGRKQQIDMAADVKNKIEGKVDVVYNDPISQDPEFRKRAARLIMEAENKDKSSEPGKG